MTGSSCFEFVLSPNKERGKSARTAVLGGRGGKPKRSVFIGGRGKKIRRVRVSFTKGGREGEKARTHHQHALREKGEPHLFSFILA